MTTKDRIKEIEERLEKYNRQPAGNTKRVEAIEVFLGKAPEMVDFLLTTLREREKEAEKYKAAAFHLHDGELVHALQEEVAELKESLEKSRTAHRVEGITSSEALTQRDTARAALNMYGDHLPTCRIHSNCTCGYTAALEACK